MHGRCKNVDVGLLFQGKIKEIIFRAKSVQPKTPKLHIFKGLLMGQMVSCGESIEVTRAINQLLDEKCEEQVFFHPDPAGNVYQLKVNILL